MRADAAVASQARAVAGLCLLVAGLSGLWTASECFSLSLGWDAPLQAPAARGPDAEAAAKFRELAMAAVAPDRQSRVALLVLLAVSLSFTFVSAGRFLRPRGLPLDGIRRLLSGAALLSAFLRTVDGAQEAALSVRIGRGLQKLDRLPGLDARAQELVAPWTKHLPAVLVGQVALRTALLAGALLIVGQYFRSSRMKAWAAVQDGAAE